MTTVRSVFESLARSPGELLVRRWNWKAAVSSSLVRSLLFFAVNLTAGFAAAVGAMLTEFAYRAISAGFYGALTQSFRKVEPRWQGAAAATFVLVTLSHSVEFGIHWARGTPNLVGSIAASCALTAMSTLFNLHAMRNGVLVTGGEGYGFWEDIRMLPGVIASILPRGFSQIR